jgi:hypothetical protein
MLEHVVPGWCLSYLSLSLILTSMVQTQPQLVDDAHLHGALDIPSVIEHGEHGFTRKLDTLDKPREGTAAAELSLPEGA